MFEFIIETVMVEVEEENVGFGGVKFPSPPCYVIEHVYEAPVGTR